ncbi:MAG: tryptophan synthase subunit alpha [Candidatus Omnitrophica bacterium]|nr:tryptophan synthase subunit alpha [Candidatus Omnitrophota bacterium]
MNRIEKKFKELKKSNKKAFIAFITAGYPNLSATKQLVKALSANGADIIELGVPFSDPMADGVIIQEASQYSLKKKINLDLIMKMSLELRQENIAVPLCLMTYYNPVFCYGDERFIKKAVQSGIDGVIIPDLPIDEAVDFIKTANKYGLDTINFISPTTSNKRVEKICRASKGFIYYVSLTGVTGARNNLAADLKENIRRIKRFTSKPVCVGFGVSNSRQVKYVQGFADGVIVGSAIVRKIKDNLGKIGLVNKVAAYTRSLSNV